jgi:hypothetical protein
MLLSDLKNGVDLITNFSDKQIDLSVDNWDLGDKLHDLMYEIVRGTLKEFTFVSKENINIDNSDDLIVQLVYKHTPSGKFVAIEGSSDSWYDDGHFGDYGRIYEAVPKEITKLIYVEKNDD